MKEKRLFVLYFLVPLLTWIPVYAQGQYCQNLDFSSGNFTNWEGYTWRYSTAHPDINSSPVRGIQYRRQTIITDNSAFDPNTGNQLKLIPPGYKYSARLGDGETSEDGSVRCWQQSLKYTMTIDSYNTLLILKFALVLQYDGGHEPQEEPRFGLTLYDQSGDTIPDCANYDVFATNSSVKGFHLYRINDKDSVQWRDWTTVGVNLTRFLGQTITIEFMAADCILGFDFGYAYFVASCQPLSIITKNCVDDSVAILTAPEGFEKYSWKNSNGEVVDTLQFLQVISPPENAVYSCEMISATGCDVSLQTTLNRYSPKADFYLDMINCNTNEVQLINSSTTNRGNLAYLWDFKDGNTSTEKDPKYQFLTSGMHLVSLVIKNLPSSCTDTLTKEVESFYPPWVDIEGESTYCPGLGVLLKAYGAYEYEWSNGSKDEVVEVFAPGGDYWLIGRSSTGCSDTNYITISEEPDWEFLASGDTFLCVGDSIFLSAHGAISYVWNTGDTINSLLVSAPGTYICAGINARGCEKTNTINIELIPPPEVAFTLSDHTLNDRNNILTCSLPSLPDMQYVWDMGDGLTETGSTIQHAYGISNGILTYRITLTATDQYGCIDSSYDIIDIIPFIPNIFSPNDDGINDVFMPEIDLEIFDRNGILIYKGTEGWDGRYKKQPVDPDTYFYSIYYINRLQQEQNKKGYVTLVR